MKKQAGYSLVEIIIIIALLAVLTVVVFITLRTTGQHHLETAVQRIGSDVSYAQSTALSKRGWYGVRFDVSSNSYTVYEYDPSTAAETAINNPANMGNAFRIYLDQSYNKISIAAVHCDTVSLNNFILFNGDGVPCGVGGVAYTATCEVKVAHEDGNYKWFYVHPQSGRISF